MGSTSKLILPAAMNIKQESHTTAYFACRECSQVFFSDVNLKVHLLSHNKVVRVGCTKCDNVHVYDIKQLRQHVSTCHANSIKPNREFLTRPKHLDNFENSIDDSIVDYGKWKVTDLSLNRWNKHNQLVCPMCSKDFNLTNLDDIEKHIDQHSNEDIEILYCIASSCNEKKGYHCQSDVTDYLFHLAEHYGSSQDFPHIVLTMIQSVIRILLFKINCIHSQCTENIRKNLENEDKSREAVLFIQEILSSLPIAAGKTKVRKLIRQSSLNSERPSTLLYPKLVRDDSICGEFGGIDVAKCDLCDIYFSSTVEAQVHGLAHRDETRAYLSCALCHQLKKYLKVDALRQHLKCHAKLQPSLQQHVVSMQQQQQLSESLLTNFVAPTGIIKYMNEQQQQLQKTLSEDHGTYKQQQQATKRGGGAARMKREVSCPAGEQGASCDSNDLTPVSAAGPGDAADGSGSSEQAADAGGSSVKRLRFSESLQVFHCHECDLSFQLDDLTHFCQHLQQHSPPEGAQGSKLFRCHVCKKRFVGEQMREFVKHLCSHMLVAGGGAGGGAHGLLHCSRCGATFADDEMDEFYGHVLQHKQQLEIFHCGSCGAKLCTSREMARHITASGGGGGCGRGTVSCGLCAAEGGATFANLALLVEHMSGPTHCSDPQLQAACITDLYQCDECSYTGRAPLAYQQHALRDHNLHITLCMLCLQLCDDQWALTQHLATKHATTTAPLDNPAVTVTSTSTVDASNIIKAVYKAVTNEPLYCCHQCGIYFEQEATFSTHMTHHTASNRSVCDVCHTHFTTNTDLAQHLMSATCAGGDANDELD